MNKVHTYSIEAFGLLAIMLFSLSGFSLHKMTCLVSGTSMVSVGEIEDRRDPQPYNSVSAKCCDVSQIAVQITDLERTTKHNLDTTPVVLPSAAALSVNAAFIARNIKSLNKAPPPKGVDVQALLEVFLI